MVRLRINKNVDRVRLKISFLERDNSILHSKEFVKKAIAFPRALSHFFMTQGLSEPEGMLFSLVAED